MKKVIAMLLSLTLLLGMTGCNKQSEKDVSVSTTTQQDIEKQKEIALQKMQQPIDALVRCMIENDMEYAPKDAEFFWTALAYYVPEYAQEHPLATVEDDVVRLNTKAVQEIAIALFAEYDDLLELPKGMENRVRFDEGKDEYIFTRGDVGNAKTEITVEEETEDSIVLTATLYAETKEDVLGTWKVKLTENTYADSITDPMYLYSVASVEPVEEQTQPNQDDTTKQPATHGEEIQETAIFGGLSDSHTVELTMSDGSIQAFQFQDAAVADALSSYELDDTLTITYTKSPSGMLITKVE